MHQMNLNPWISMWTNPRKTIREIVNISPRKGFFLLAVFFGLQYLLNFAHTFSLGIHFDPIFILIVSIVVSPILGYFWFYLFGACLYYSGKMLKGQSRYFQILSSMAWSSVPYILTVFMWFLFMVTSTYSVFIQQTDGFTFFFISLVILISAIWSLVLILKCLMEVQEFSCWRAIGNYLLGLVFYYIALFAVAACFALISRLIVMFV